MITCVAEGDWVTTPILLWGVPGIILKEVRSSVSRRADGLYAFSELVAAI